MYLQRYTEGVGMSVVDLAADTVFSQSEDDNCRESTYHSEEARRGNEECSDSNDEGVDDLPSLPCDYTELELAQRTRRRGKQPCICSPVVGSQDRVVPW
jgi:hypothetical protein